MLSGDSICGELTTWECVDCWRRYNADPRYSDASRMASVLREGLKYRVQPSVIRPAMRAVGCGGESKITFLSLLFPVSAEQSKDRENGAKESWVNNINKDAFPSPELSGVVQEPREDVAPTSPR